MTNPDRPHRNFYGRIKGKALKAQDISLVPNQIKLEGPLKELGLYTVNIQLHPSVTSELKVWVVPAVADEGSK